MLTTMSTSEPRGPLTNWAGNHTYPAERWHRPATVEQLQEIVSAARSVHVLGSRHSFNGIADAADLISLEAMHTEQALPAAITVDAGGRTVSFGGGVKYGELVERLHDEGLALQNLASLPHISVAGAVATATHGSGSGNGNLATAVAALELVTSSGEIIRSQRGDADFEGMVVGLGALGAVTRLTLDVEPAFEVRQDVFEGLAWSALLEHLDEVMACGYSVSVFTVFRETVDMVWVKSRTDAGEPSTELFGARPATVDLHPVIGLDPRPCTPQLGRPGPWFDRLPHFRMGFTPSAGAAPNSDSGSGSPESVRDFTHTMSTASRKTVKTLTLYPDDMISSKWSSRAAQRSPSNTSCRTSKDGSTSRVRRVTAPRAPSPTTRPSTWCG